MLLSKLGHAKDREKSIDLCQRVKENIFESVTAQEYLRSVAQYLVPNAVLGGTVGSRRFLKEVKLHASTNALI